MDDHCQQHQIAAGEHREAMRHVVVGPDHEIKRHSIRTLDSLAGDVCASHIQRIVAQHRAATQDDLLVMVERI